MAAAAILLLHSNLTYVRAGRPENMYLVQSQASSWLGKKSFFFGHLFFNITNVFCAKKRVRHACICPRMVTS